MEFKHSYLIIELKWSGGDDKRFEITCKSVDLGNDIVVSDFIIYFCDTTQNFMKNFSIVRKWVLNKNTRLAFENLTFIVYLDSSKESSFKFALTKIYIKPNCTNRIVKIKPSKDTKFETGISLIDMFDFSKSGFTDNYIANNACPITHTLQNILRNKVLWITVPVLFLIVTVIVAIKLGVLKKQQVTRQQRSPEIYKPAPVHLCTDYTRITNVKGSTYF
ncbi:hypothetical protein RF11_00780 [Thelohanellus kitauei]|uniref:Uncharacterized protein n=1 Tax=Thelohanellus kitauei TaxID=669202 RepID=A0A0C2MXB9_THEKT|nr:hypothetical protein RF11_00780 [Thelohanellus kitauei]